MLQASFSGICVICWMLSADFLYAHYNLTTVEP